jgi:hypothetical protein
MLVQQTEDTTLRVIVYVVKVVLACSVALLVVGSLGLSASYYQVACLPFRHLMSPFVVPHKCG